MKNYLKGLAYFLFCAWSAAAFAQTAWDSLPGKNAYYKQRVAAFRSQGASGGKVLFLGNSITEGGNWRQLMADSSIVNRGISGDITFGVIQRVDEVVRFKPSKLFLLIGINDLSKGIPEDIVLENIFLIVGEIRKQSPSTKVFVQSLFPVNPTFKNFRMDYNVNDKVITINTQLQKIERRFGYAFVDLHKQFVDADGLLDKRYSYDGLHLNATGYQRWAKILKDEKYL